MVFKKLLKKFTEKKEIVKKTQFTKISFEKIEDWINKKEKDVENSQFEFFSKIKNKSKILGDDLTEKLVDLKNFNFDTIKVEPKTKAIVKANLENYLLQLDILINKLNNIIKVKNENLILHINNAFIDFDKMSYTSYQKANYLVGNELVAVKKSIGAFSKDYRKLTDTKSMRLSNALSEIKVKFNNYKEINELKKDNEIRIENINENIKISKQNQNELNSKIETIKKSSEHIENENNINTIKELSNELTLKINNLRQLLDFKKLTYVFHVSPKNMDIIKKYKNDFHTSLSDSSELLSLLDEAQLNNNTIRNKINEINEIKNKIKKLKSKLYNDKISKIESKIESLKKEITNLHSEKNKELKLNDKTNQQLNDMKSEIKLSFSKIDIKIIK